MRLAGRLPGGPRAFIERRPTFAAIVYTALPVLPLFLVSAAAVQVQHDLGFNKAQLGLAVALCFAASALVSPSLGYHVERSGPSLRLPAVLSLLALAGIALLARHWWELVAALVLAGVANASAQVSTNVSLTGVSERRQGVAFGAKQAGVPIGSLVAGLAMPPIVVLAGWRAGFAAAAALAAVMVAIAPRLEPEPSGRDDGERWRPSSLIAALCVTGLCAGAVGNSLAAFTVDSAVAQGLSESAGGALLAAGSTAAVLVRVAAGWLVDRRRSNGLGELLALTTVAVAAFVLLRLSGESHALFVAGVLVGFATGWGWQGLMHYATVRSQPSAPAASSGLVLTAIYVGMIVGPVGLGLVAEHSSYTNAWILSATFSLVAAVGALAARRLAPPVRSITA
jgi:MFS family permease